MNQHTNMLAASIPLLTYKHRVYGVLFWKITTRVLSRFSKLVAGATSSLLLSRLHTCARNKPRQFESASVRYCIRHTKARPTGTACLMRRVANWFCPKSPISSKKKSPKNYRACLTKAAAEILTDDRHCKKLDQAISSICWKFDFEKKIDNLIISRNGIGVLKYD